jgi:hypothetical protein
MKLWAQFLRTLTVVALLVGFISSIEIAARADNAKSAASSPSQFAKLLSEPLPGHPKPQAEASFYKPDTLYQYIDGGADVYLLYDFQVLLHQDFKAGAADITADVYDMGKPEDAFGIYSAERSPK